MNNGQTQTAAIQKCKKQIQNYSYFKQDKLGCGYSSEVYRGTDDRNGDIVAIKVINLKKVKQNGLEQMLNRQIKIIQISKHDNVIRCIDVLKSSNNCYIITEYCPDGDLQKFINQPSSLSENDLLQLVRQICLGLSFLHSRGIIHRDIKPQNILLVGKHPKIADFGFAIKAQQSIFQRFTIGSPLYMSPEALNNRQYSHKNDVWALGITFFEIMQKKAPWHAKSDSQLKQLIKGQLKFKQTKCLQIQALIRRCLSYDSPYRYTSDQILSKIQGYLGIRSQVNWSLPDQKQNNKTCINQQIQTQSQDLKKSMRTNYNILKWYINYTRFTSKLIPKLQQNLYNEQLKKPLIQFTAKMLYHNITKLSKLDQYNSQLNLKDYIPFKRTSRYSKIQAVTREYKQRYLLILAKLPYTYHLAPGLTIIPPPQIYQALEEIPIDGGCKQEYLLTIQFFMILMNTNSLIRLNNLGRVMEMVNFQDLVQKTPPYFNDKMVNEILHKKQRIIKQGKSSTSSPTNL